MKRVRIHGRRVAGLAASVALVICCSQLVSVPSAEADETANSNVTATVDEAFSFGVAGKNSGTCNGSVITGTGSTAGEVSLGSVDKTTSAVGGQELTVAGNAGGGFSVYARVDGPLTDGKGNTIANIAGSNSSPSPFAPPGIEAFGYTTDSTLSGAVPDRFINGSGKWAGISTNDAEVMYSNTTGSKTACVAYQITISSNTVGGFYGNNVTYTAIPAF
jgi:hypothetical protein